MSNNQWEIVTNIKKQKILERKALNVKKREIKLDEIVPTLEYRKLVTGKLPNIGTENMASLQSSSSSSFTNKSTPKKTVKIKKQQQGIEQQEAKQSKQQQHQQQQQKLASKPKNFESAIKSLNKDDFLNQLEQLRVACPGSELLWLKGIASYLNLAVPYDFEPTIANKSIHYPSSLLQEPMKCALVEFLTNIAEVNLEYIYFQLIDSMATEMSKNLTVAGYKVILQLIGQNWPEICTKSMCKVALLRNSYQNRKNICLNILWAVSQGGYQKLAIGVKVWSNLMLPLLDMKSFSHFVADYFAKILKVTKDQNLPFDQSEFFIVYNALRKRPINIPEDIQVSLQNSADLFLQKYIACQSKHSNLFLTLFREIKSLDAAENAVELNGCVGCLKMSEDCFKVWKQNYKKQWTPSALLLNTIEHELDDVNSNFIKSKVFNEFLSEAGEYTLTMKTKRQDPFLDELNKALKNVQEKTSQQKKRQAAGGESKKCGCCKWFWGSLLLIVLIAGALIYDTNTNGKGIFAKSATGKVLKDAGVLPYVEKGWYTTMSTSARGYKWAEKHVPPYAAPALQLSCDLFKLARNTACNGFGHLRDYLSRKLPVVAAFVEQYAPGLPDKIESFSVTVKNAAVNAYGKTAEIVKTQVLVGRLSPDNILIALNQTRNAALEYYNIFHNKVDAYAKLK